MAYYVFTWVDPSGAQTIASPSVTATLGVGIAVPANPTVLSSVASGTLPGGGYFYAISAYTGTTTAETPANSGIYTFLSGVGNNHLIFPTLPFGATGFNVYVKPANTLGYVFLDSTTGSSYIDDGSVTPSTSRTLTNLDTTNSTGSVTFTLPSAVPVGWTWNLYRTTQFGQWTNSLLASITTLSGGATPVVLTTYTDVGNGTLAGTPPLVSQVIGSPSRINLATSVTGLLPTANVAAYPMILSFGFTGPLVITTGKNVWTSEFSSAKIVSVRASLGRLSVPVSSAVIVDVVKGTGGSTPTYTSIFPTGPKPQVAVGVQIGAAQAPPSTTFLNPGDSVSVDLTQVGGGATPTDHDLTVTIYLLVTVP